MKIDRFQDLHAFREIALPLLAQDEAVNNLPIGVLSTVVQKPNAFGKEAPFLVIIEDGVRKYPVLRTPPAPLLLTDLSREAVSALVEYLIANEIILEHANGPVEVVDQFATEYSEKSDAHGTLLKAYRIFSCDSLIPAIPASGTVKIGAEEDRTLISRMWQEFMDEASLRPTDVSLLADRSIREGLFRFWMVDGVAVSMASATGPTPNGIRIIGVYTPKVFRGRGYASNLTAALTQELLDGGRKFCFLFTDQKNPISNSIYQKIGYRPIADTHEWKFETRLARS